MMDRRIPPETQELHAYVDGELDPARRLEIEAWLSRNPGDAERVRAYREIGHRLHQRFDRVLAMPAAPAQVPAVRMRPEPRWWSGSMARSAAVVLLMLASGITGWLLHRHIAAPSGAMAAVSEALVIPALFAHEVYASDSDRPVEVPGIQRAQLDEWVSHRMHVPLRAPDLSRFGLRLVGGRLLPSTNRMAAQFMYEDGEGRRTTVYVRRISGGGTGEFLWHERGELHAFYWFDSQMGYALVGEQPAGELIRVAGAVQAAFSGRDRDPGSTLPDSS